MFDTFNVWKKIQEDEATRPLELEVDENNLTIRDEDMKARIVISYKEFEEMVQFVEFAKKIKGEK